MVTLHDGSGGRSSSNRLKSEIDRQKEIEKRRKKRKRVKEKRKEGVLSFIT